MYKQQLYKNQPLKATKEKAVVSLKPSEQKLSDKLH